MCAIQRLWLSIYIYSQAGRLLAGSKRGRQGGRLKDIIGHGI